MKRSAEELTRPTVERIQGNDYLGRKIERGWSGRGARRGTKGGYPCLEWRLKEVINRQNETEELEHSRESPSKSDTCDNHYPSTDVYT